VRLDATSDVIVGAVLAAASPRETYNPPSIAERMEAARRKRRIESTARAPQVACRHGPLKSPAIRGRIARRRDAT
jgi:hypothetical protein